jgi:hypothetical protein
VTPAVARAPPPPPPPPRGGGMEAAAAPAGVHAAAAAPRSLLTSRPPEAVTAVTLRLTSPAPGEVLYTAAHDGGAGPPPSLQSVPLVFGAEHLAITQYPAAQVCVQLEHAPIRGLVRASCRRFSTDRSERRWREAAGRGGERCADATRCRWREARSQARSCCALCRRWPAYWWRGPARRCSSRSASASWGGATTR